MPGKRYTAEQIVAKLREAERLQGQGMTIPQVCKRLKISEQTFYRWRTKYGALKEDEVRLTPLGGHGVLVVMLRRRASHARRGCGDRDRPGDGAGCRRPRCSRTTPGATHVSRSTGSGRGCGPVLV